MFEWVYIRAYADVFYNLMMILSLIVGVHSMSFDIRNQKKIANIRILGFFLLIFILLYVGFRPIHGVFVDMKTYDSIFRRYQNGRPLNTETDALYQIFMWTSSKYMSSTVFFFVNAVLYILPMYVFSQKHFKSYWPYVFIAFIGSFSFWGYATNGIRNGVATSLFLWGLANYNRKLVMYCFFVVAFFMHASLVIPISAFIASIFLIKRPKLFFLIWIAAIPISIIGGSYWVNFFNDLGLFEERTQGYLEGGEQYMKSFSSTGFRWDFLFYSSFPMMAAWYFIIKKKINDAFYIHLFGTYAIANAFWILLISVAFSNRFAYVSWFLMAPVILYPLCKYNISNNQYRVLGSVLFLYYLFTYLMQTVYYGT